MLPFMLVSPCSAYDMAAGRGGGQVDRGMERTCSMGRGGGVGVGRDSRKHAPWLLQKTAPPSMYIGAA